MKVFHNDLWISESVTLRREAFYVDASDFDDVLRTWIENVVLESNDELTLQEFETSWGQSNYQAIRKKAFVSKL